MMRLLSGGSHRSSLPTLCRSMSITMHQSYTTLHYTSASTVGLLLVRSPSAEVTPIVATVSVEDILSYQMENLNDKVSQGDM